MQSLVIVDHGSRSPDGTLDEMLDLVRASLGATWLVRGAHLEILEPDLPSAIDACVNEGAHDVIVAPLLISMGRHASRDIPRLVEQARERHPTVRFSVAPALGADRALADLLLARAGLMHEHVIVREDEHGQRYELERFGSGAQAQEKLRAYESLGHKQMYWIE